MRARLGLVVVDLLVPGEFLLRVEHLTARAYEIFSFFLDVVMMPIAMLDEIRVPPKSFIAHRAFDGSFARVNVLVFVQFLFRKERFLANDTFVRFNS